jgi:hypothetical protein
MDKNTQGTINVICYLTFVFGFLILVGGWDNFCTASKNIPIYFGNLFKLFYLLLEKLLNDAVG